MIKVKTPISDEVIRELQVGDTIEITGLIFTGRDAALPRLVKLYQENLLMDHGIDLNGGIIFHTAVSPAGVGPTSSNKSEIEDNIGILSEAGIKIHVGKGSLKESTIEELKNNNSVYAVTPPVTALLGSKIKSKKIIAFPEEGMEAMHVLEVENFPAIIAAAKGETIF